MINSNNSISAQQFQFTKEVDVKPMSTTAVPNSIIGRTVKWLRGGESTLSQILRRAVAIALAILLAASIVGIGALKTGIKEWKRQAASDKVIQEEKGKSAHVPDHADHHKTGPEEPEQKAGEETTLQINDPTPVPLIDSKEPEEKQELASGKIESAPTWMTPEQMKSIHSLMNDWDKPVPQISKSDVDFFGKEAPKSYLIDQIKFFIPKYHTEKSLYGYDWSKLYLSNNEEKVEDQIPSLSKTPEEAVEGTVEDNKDSKTSPQSQYKKGQELQGNIDIEKGITSEQILSLFSLIQGVDHTSPQDSTGEKEWKKIHAGPKPSYNIIVVPEKKPGGIVRDQQSAGNCTIPSKFTKFYQIDPIESAIDQSDPTTVLHYPSKGSSPSVGNELSDSYSEDYLLALKSVTKYCDQESFSDESKD